MIFKLLEIGDDKFNKFNIDNNNEKIAKKPEKSKSKKLSKSQKLVKSEKKLLKSENLLNFGTKEAEPNFLTFSTRKILNCL